MNMKSKRFFVNLIVFLSMAIAVVVGFIDFQPDFFNEVSAQSQLEPQDTTTQDFKRGPHQGKLLQTGDFQVEVTIFEPEGIPPKFRIYFYNNGVPIQSSEIKYQMELTRINRVENIPFKDQTDYLESTVEATEPHSFKVRISAAYKNETYEWEYESYEGRIELSSEAIKANAIKIEKAQSTVLKIKLNAMGKIMPNEEATVYISPRFPGVVKAVYKRLGDYVKKGETLAVIESNESLQNYEVRSEVDGMIIKKNINIGMYISGQENIFVISDLKTVWADFNIYRHDLSQVKIDDPVEIKSLDGSLTALSTISYISPLGHESTQSVIARAILSNPKELWKPGLFISGEISVANVYVPIAIKDSALQTFRDWDVVFIASGNVFEVVPVQLGKRNKEWIEITSGLVPGDHYVTENSFILKADLEKSGAKHEH